MDVYFEPTRGRSFSIEVGYFDTIQEIKEKIQKYHNIPTPKQTLIFNNQTLADDLNVHSSDIIENSRIQLIITADAAATPEKPMIIKVKEESSPPPATPPQPPPQPPAACSKKIQLLLKMPTSKLGMAMELDVNEPIRRIKERVYESEGIPVGQIAVHASGIELLDHKTLQESGLLDHSEIDVSLRRVSPATSLGAPGNVTTTMMTTTTTAPIMNNSKKLKILVLTKCGTKKIPVEVNASDNVGELRKELQKMNQWVQLHLPQEGYFFIYKQNVMEDDRSFRWHHVGQGDTIEIFNGSITGGS